MVVDVNKAGKACLKGRLVEVCGLFSSNSLQGVCSLDVGDDCSAESWEWALFFGHAVPASLLKLSWENIANLLQKASLCWPLVVSTPRLLWFHSFVEISVWDVCEVITPTSALSNSPDSFDKNSHLSLQDIRVPGVGTMMQEMRYHDIARVSQFSFMAGLLLEDPNGRHKNQVV